MRPGARRLAALGLAIALAVGVPACSSDKPSGPVAVPAIPIDPASTAPTDKAIAKAQKRLVDVPNDDGARTDLAELFLQKVRENADPSLYARAATLLDDVVRRRPDDIRVLSDLGTLALARHQFREALDLAHKAVALAPTDERSLGVLVDACNELGRYDEALSATERMVDAKPNLPSLSRASYARELRGDLRGAIAAMTSAATAGTSSAVENQAYIQSLLAGLLITSGDLRQAELALSKAERVDPGFPAAVSTRAKLLVAQGKPGEAADLLADIVERQPLPEYAVARGDALRAAGRTAEADEADELVRVLNTLFKANGVDTDLELALFDADHAPGAGAVERARKAAKARPSTFGHDVLAWNLFKAGKAKEAAVESKAALALGSVDPQLRFHAAAIAEANGDRTAATDHLRIVLASNPRFSAFLLADVAALAGRLGLEVPPPAA